MVEKYVLINFIFALQLNLNAQIIDQQWNPKIGDKLETFTANNPEEINPGASGIDQVWDFSNAISAGTVTISEYIEPSSLQLSQLFPQANIAFDLRDNIDDYYFMKSNENGLSILGYINNDLGIRWDYPDPRELITYPVSFNETKTYKATIEQINVSGTILNTRDHTEEITFDGVGTMITPLNTFTDCYRFKFYYYIGEEQSPDNAYSGYYYFKNAYSNPIATYQDFGDISSFMWMEEINSLVSAESIFYQSGIDLKHISNGLFQLEVEQSAIYEFVIFDIQGKQVVKTKRELLSGNNQISIQGVPNNQISILLVLNTSSGKYDRLKFIN